MRRIAAFLALALPLCSAAYAQSSGAVYAFGDSLTDNGNIPALLGGIDSPAPPYYKNHFSNGPVFVEYLPALIGDRFAALNDYGVGGAFAGDGNLVPLPQLPGTAQEIAGAAASGLRFTAADTVILWAGSNNYFSIIGNLPAGTTIADPAVQTDIRSVSSYVVSDTANLIRLGAHTLVVLNVPDLGATPGQTAAGVSQISTQISQANNRLEQSGLLALQHATGANIYLINAQLGIEEILANPARFGIRNTTSECILTPACVNASRAVQDTYLFWDDVHPTTGVHDALAHDIANQLQAGKTIGGQAELMILQTHDFTDSLAQRLDLQRAASPAQAALSVYLQGHYGSGNRDSARSSGAFSYDTGAVVAGADYRVAPGLIVGAAGGYGQPNARFDDGSGKLGFDAYQGGVYASLFTPVAYLNLAGAYTRFDTLDGERPAVLAGETLRFAPRGHAWAASATAGTLFHAGTLTWGPVAGLSYVDAIVDPYAETGEPLLAQSVARQSVDSLVGRAGLQANVGIPVGGLTLRPNLLVEAEREFLDTKRSVETSFLSAGLPIAAALAGYTGTYGRIGLGTAIDVTRSVSGILDVQTTIGRGNGEDRSVVLKVNAAF